ncbi:MAG TPA: DUF4429 domain-containing protein [Nocardiopsis listeri]|uniref:DUF4429 domain-containing protein n=1 Tax=Nocardiopsis listeri TaxID=53440 RepID=UPI001DD09305|nr:DUF4429 domain-containing protein [Nocardiopsis listeri]HJE58905.1 DUF4429 domain-containing protein [Nocardiopsis listeri]
MDELRGEQAVWVFDSETVRIRFETKGWFKSPLFKLLGTLDLPVGLVRDVDFRPGAGRKKGWILNLRLHDRMDPYSAVGAMLDENFQPFRLTGPAKTELVAEYLADQLRFAAGRAREPDPRAVLSLVPPRPLHVLTSEGTARFEGDRLSLVWSGGHAGGYKKKKQRREFDLAEIDGMEWAPVDDWGWGFVRVVGRGRPVDAKPRTDLNVLRAGDEGNEIHQAFLLAATVTAHLWAQEGAARAAIGAGDGGMEQAPPVGFDDPEWWKRTARSAVDALRGPRITLNLPGGRGAGSDGDASVEIGEDGPEAPENPGESPGGLREPAQRTDTSWIFEQIERLGDLHAKGLLTDEEFSTKKAELLDRI